MFTSTLSIGVLKNVTHPGGGGVGVGGGKGEGGGSNGGCLKVSTFSILFGTQ